jgi:hypothetical protein
MSISLDRLVATPIGLPPTLELGQLQPHEIPATFGQEALPMDRERAPYSRHGAPEAMASIAVPVLVVTGDRDFHVM